MATLANTDTGGVRWVPGPHEQRSYFYDVHRGCYENATPDQITDIESMVIDGVQ